MEYSFTEKKRPSARYLQHKITAICAAVIMGVIAVGSLVLPDRAFSDEENRTLAQAPKLSSASLQSGTFFSDLSTYLQDQIAGRDMWMRLKVTETRMSGMKESGDVFLGKNGYLLEKPAVPDQAKIDRSIEQIRAFVQQYPDLNMVMTLVPCAAAVFPDLLPDGAPVHDQLSDIGYVRNKLVDVIPFIEMQTAFRNDSINQIYYRTDHHWTSRGALDAFQAIRWELGIDSAEYFVPMTVSMDFEGTLASRSGSHVQKDTVEIYRPENEDYQYYTYYPDTQERIPSIFVTEKLEEKDKYQVFFGGNHPVLTVRTTVDNGRSLLIFKDSYANSFVQFLLPYYERIVLVDPRYYYEDIKTLISSEAITDVLFLYSMNTFAADGSLADVLSQVTEQTEAVSMGAAEPGTADETGAETEASSENPEQAAETSGDAGAQGTEKSGDAAEDTAEDAAEGAAEQSGTAGSAAEDTTVQSDTAGSAAEDAAEQSGTAGSAAEDTAEQSGTAGSAAEDGMGQTGTAESAAEDTAEKQDISQEVAG